MKATGENCTDYETIRHDINELAKQYNIREIAVDRWNASTLVTQLCDHDGWGDRVIMFGQGFASMTSPTKDLERLVANGKLCHGGNPVLRWMASNVVVKQDEAGNLKPDKKKSSEKIDGIVALIMALGRAALRTDHTNPFDDPAREALYV
jgi:phage terminase large subunit-like protein